MTQLASDNFTRANGGLGANWTVVSTSAVFQIASNLANVSNLSLDSIYRYNAVSFPNDQYAETTLSTPTSSAANHGYGPCVRCDTAGAFSAYRLVCGGAGYSLDKYVAGVHTDISGALATTTFANGDVVRLTIKGTTLSMTKNGVAFGITYTDASLAAGAAGIGYSGTDSAGGALSLWAGGSAGGPLWPAYLRRAIAPLLRR